MQLPTHVLVGIMIQFLVFQLFEGPTWLLFLLVFIFGFSSHFLHLAPALYPKVICLKQKDSSQSSQDNNAILTLQPLILHLLI